MGLDTTHGAWSGSYSGFNNWRTAIAKHIGIEDLRKMKGYGGDIEWDKYIDHDLYPLLIHSDCDGELTPEECIKTSRGLTLILPQLDEQEKSVPEAFRWVADAARQFIEGCNLAVERDQAIEFN